VREGERIEEEKNSLKITIHRFSQRPVRTHKCPIQTRAFEISEMKFLQGVSRHNVGPVQTQHAESLYRLSAKPIQTPVLAPNTNHRKPILSVVQVFSPYFLLTSYLFGLILVPNV
jgi:hypothetical protein